MSYAVKEITSERLVNSYPAYYLESQIQNWTVKPIVVTDRHGNQEVIAQCLANQIDSRSGHVACEWRFINGIRSQPGVNCTRDVPVPGGRIELSFNELLARPVYIKEIDVVISTVEMSSLAIHPCKQDIFLEKLCDSADATEMSLDRPTFAITANDPDYLYDKLYAYLFGRVIEIIPKHIQVIESPFRDNIKENIAGIFVSYRQGMDDYAGESIHIPFDNVDNGKPCDATDGTSVFIATSEEKLRDIIKDRHDRKFDELRGMLNTSKIISKDIYEKAMKLADEKYTSTCKKHEDEKKAMIEERRISEQKLKNEAEKEKLARQAAEERELRWKTICDARSAIDEHESKIKEQNEKTRKESYLADQESIKRDAIILKTIGTAGAAFLAFGLTMLAKHKK